MRGGALAHNPFDAVVADPLVRIVHYRFAPADVTGIGFHATQFQNLPVVYRAQRDPPLPRREGHLDNYALDINHFHLACLP